MAKLSQIKIDMTRQGTIIASIGLVVSLLAGGAYVLSKPYESGAIQATLSVTHVLGGDTNGYARAAEPRVFSFPRDHGPHSAYRTEWWYYTGNLETQSGRHFGFQLTFFRSALAASVAARESAWGTRHVYMAHLAVADVEAGQFHAFERFSRAAVGLAGAQAEPFRVWVDDWSVAGGQEDGLPMRLQAGQEGIALDLTLQSAKPVVLQGEQGLSQKGPEKGAASYYYSFTRMLTQGRITIGDQTFEVSGTSWMDREWSTSVLGKDQVGWDWFALQLSDGSELMFFQLRRADETIDVFSGGTLVRPNGETYSLKHDEVQLEVESYWTSPRSQGRYPSEWQVRIPAENLELMITPYLADQELPLSIVYWEGAVQVQGKMSGRDIGGHGYVELTGYLPGGTSSLAARSR